MVHREHFINKIRTLKYHYKGRQKRTDLYRKAGGTHYISVPLKDLLEEEFVTSTLRQTGLNDPEIRDFLRSTKS